MSNSTDKLALLTRAFETAIKANPSICDSVQSFRLDWDCIDCMDGDSVVVPIINIEFK